ncbi:MAG TPA: CPBP family intramembrane glutamic endopeptidase [Candidatus Acidoferrales bacterium]|nr:CPBP family intramembrane glutamic endopeptidase [Candidatus Acidoferrales bacterium]
MKSYKRILIFLLLVLALTGVLSPWMAALWNAILHAVPEWRDYQQPFSRIFSRLYMVMGIVLFFVCRRMLGIESFRQMGLTRERAWWRDVVMGFLLACGSFAAVVAAMAFAGVFTPGFRRSLASALGSAFGALMAGLTVGFIEEIFFRGMIFKGLVEDTRKAAAYCLANLFYSVIHFVKPAEKVPLTEIDPLAGFRYLAGSFAALLDLREILPGVIGLFLIGIALSYAFFRTGSLYLAIGLHAGWVFSLKTFDLFGRARRRDMGWLFGASEPKIVSGVATWIGIIAVVLVIHWATRNRKALGAAKF